MCWNLLTLINIQPEVDKLNGHYIVGKIPIIGVGGIASGQDAYEKILAGATVVQLYSALVYHGPILIKIIKEDLAQILRYLELSHLCFLWVYMYVSTFDLSSLSYIYIHRWHANMLKVIFCEERMKAIKIMV